MKRLTKDNIAEQNRLRTAILANQTDLETAITDYNAAMAAAKEAVETELAALNESIEQAAQFMCDLHADAQSEFDERSEKWQESDRGQEFSAWVEEFQQEIPLVEIEFPDELESPEVDLSALENLRESADA